MMNHGRLTLIFAVLLVAALMVGTVFALEGRPRRDFTEARELGQSQSEYLIVTFKNPPAASYEGGIPGLGRTKPERGKRFDPNSQAAQAYLKHLENEHANYRSWLARNAPRAEVVREFSVVLNGLAIRLNGERPQPLQGGPGVGRAGFSALYRPAMNVSPGLIGATEFWGLVGGPGNAGVGIKIGIIDTGIDLSNSFLSDDGYPGTGQTDACAPLSKPASDNTSNKVIVCRVYASGVAAPAGAELIVFDHGTHVSGTAAGNHGTSGTVAGTDVVISDMSGIAPRALLGDYNVFPGFGAGFIAFGGSAFSHDIAAALEDTITDGMHVVNMSLG
ncbi:MAG TPA: S8 family serine peptidase, partial [Anaerolineales bacterium]